MTLSAARTLAVVQIGEAKKTDVGVVKAWLANSAHRKDWPWQVHVERCLDALEENGALPLGASGCAK
jgi:hypothetical protein